MIKCLFSFLGSLENGVQLCDENLRVETNNARRSNVHDGNHLICVNNFSVYVSRYEYKGK